MKPGSEERLRLAAKRPAAPPIESRRVSEVEPEEIRFLWSPYVPLRKVTLLEGDPGQGKSWIAAALAASGSLGLGLPGARHFEPFSTLFFTAEDGIADTLRPRLDRMAADASRIFAHDAPLNLDSGEGQRRLEHELAARQPRLVIIDPVVAYIGPRTDMYRANEVRSILAPLARLAEQHECAIVAIRHLSKSKSGRSIYAGQGSIDFTAAARSVLLAGCAADDPTEHALIHIKSNLAASGPALGYRIEDGCFAWTGRSALTAGDVLAPESVAEDRSAVEEATEFLGDLLAKGPVAVGKVLAASRRAGIAEKTLRRAKQKEGIVTLREGFGGEGGWRWSHPAPKDGQDSPKMAT